MGKRKKAAKKPSGKKKTDPLPTIFPCLFCNHEKAVIVKLDKKGGVGQLSCKVCDQKYQCQINYLSAAVDVYSDWVDACDAVAKENGRGGLGGDDRLARPGRRGREDEDEEDIDGLIDDTGVEKEGYQGEGVVADDDDEY